MLKEIVIQRIVQGLGVLPNVDYTILDATLSVQGEAIVVNGKVIIKHDENDNR